MDERGILLQQPRSFDGRSVAVGHKLWHFSLLAAVLLFFSLIFFLTHDTSVRNRIIVPRLFNGLALSHATLAHLPKYNSVGAASIWQRHPNPSLQRHQATTPGTSSLEDNALDHFYGLGFDFGTSGARINVVDRQSLAVIHEGAVGYSKQAPEVWVDAMDTLLLGIPPEVRANIKSIAISGTSASVLLVDPVQNVVTRGPLMYDFAAPPDVIQLIKKYAPSSHTVISPTSTLAKLMLWQSERSLNEHEKLCHQADFLAGQLLGPRGTCTSDWNNVLKLGFDVQALTYPSWLKQLLQDSGMGDVLPSVVAPGAKTGTVSPKVIERFGLPKDCMVVGGTTDSIAAFIASRASKPGQAVTSLGSTLAIKILSTRPVDDASFGVYSHRLGDMWLVGGASNVGCAILRQQNFSNKELADLSEQIDPMADPSTAYYPLLKPGERFPINDPLKQPVLEPRPASRRDYLHGLLHAIAKVEMEGYAQLQRMGCTPVTQVYTAGGGSVNAMWGEMRQRLLKVPVIVPEHTDAAYGVALLAVGQAV